MKPDSHLFQTIIDSLPVHLYWTNKKLQLEGCNYLQAKNFGTTVSETLGKTMYDFSKIFGWPKEFVESINSVHLQAMKSKELHVAENQVLMLDKVEHTFLTYNYPLIIDSELHGIVGISLDITDRKKMEAALKTSEERETQIRRALMILAGSMAHDLRNPLIVTCMLSNSMNKHFSKLAEGYKKAQAAGLVEADELTELQLDYLTSVPNKLLESIEQMNTFIDDDLKTISHVISGSQSRNDLIPCHINSCIIKAISHYPFEDGEKELIEWQSGDDFVFMGNPVLFYRVIFNLLKNALYQIKKHGKGKIYITTELQDDRNILRFKDTAGGVTNEIVSNLFDGFNTTKKEGTGIGLAFCQFTMRSFGGDITAHCVDKDCIEFVLSLSKRCRE